MCGLCFVSAPSGKEDEINPGGSLARDECRVQRNMSQRATNTFCGTYVCTRPDRRPGPARERRNRRLDLPRLAHVCRLLRVPGIPALPRDRVLLTPIIAILLLGRWRTRGASDSHMHYVHTCRDDMSCVESVKLVRRTVHRYTQVTTQSVRSQRRKT